MNDTLKEKFEKIYMKFKDFEEKTEENKNAQGLKFAYVVFRSMDSLDYVHNAYKKVGSCRRCCVMCCKGYCGCDKEYKDLKKKHFFKRWPKVSTACEPDNIKWENLGYT